MNYCAWTPIIAACISVSYCSHERSWYIKVVESTFYLMEETTVWAPWESSREWPSCLERLRLESCSVCLLFSRAWANWHRPSVLSQLSVCRGDNDNQLPHGVQRWQKYFHAKGFYSVQANITRLPRAVHSGLK